MKIKILFALILAMSATGSIVAQPKRSAPKTPPKIAKPVTETDATTATGKKVVLRSDGTWGFKPEALTAPVAATLAPKKMLVPFVLDSLESVIGYTEKARFDELLRSQYDTEQEHAAKLSKIKFQSATGEKPLTDIVVEIPAAKKYDADREMFTFKPNVTDEIWVPFSMALAWWFDGRYTDQYPAISFKLPREKAREVSHRMKLVAFGYPVDAI